MRFAVALGLLVCLWVSFAIPSVAWAKEAPEAGRATAKSGSGAAKKGKESTNGKAEKPSKGKAGGNGGNGDGGEGEEESGPANDSFTVVQIGADDVRVIKSSQLTPLKNKLAAEYKKALQEYNDEKLAKAKARQKFEGKKPVKKDLKVLATSLKSQDAANTLRDKTVLAIEKKKKAKEKKQGEGLPR